MATLEIGNVRYEKHDFWRFTLDLMKSWQKLKCFGLELVFSDILGGLYRIFLFFELLAIEKLVIKRQTNKFWRCQYCNF